jgi:DNA-binding transcriptional regulator YiaG
VKPGGGPGCALPDPLFAHHVTALRERLQVSGAGLARLLGMSAAAVSVWERRGKVPLSPHATSLEALERVWRMSRAAAQRKLDAG